ncbi:MAG: MgtC/SapB family protein [Thermodesulfobacteriota bacterium]
MAAKLILAGFLGAIVGYERESHGQAAGLRTNILVCISSCLIMLLSMHLVEMFKYFTDESVIRIDPGRLASYSIAGMGFLGAGAIIKGRGSVRGLTTAASLWLVTALGLAIGAGLFIPAIITSLITTIIMYKMRFLKFGIRHDMRCLLTVKCCYQHHPLKSIESVLREHEDLQIEFINYHENKEKKTITYTIRLLSKDNLRWSEIVDSLLKIECLREISWQEADVP